MPWKECSKHITCFCGHTLSGSVSSLKWHAFRPVPHRSQTGHTGLETRDLEGSGCSCGVGSAGAAEACSGAQQTSVLCAETQGTCWFGATGVQGGGRYHWTQPNLAQTQYSVPAVSTWLFLASGTAGHWLQPFFFQDSSRKISVTITPKVSVLQAAKSQCLRKLSPS